MIFDIFCNVFPEDFTVGKFLIDNITVCSLDNRRTDLGTFSLAEASLLGSTCPAVVKRPPGTRTLRQLRTAYSHVVNYK